MILVGITGILGSGKSTAASMLSREGLPVIDLDSLGKEITGHKEVVQEIKRIFGKEYAVNDGVDVRKLAERAFRDQESRRKLEGIIHPRVDAELWKRVEKLKGEGATAVIVDGPLLFETGLYKKLDKIVVVSTGMEKIKKRLRLRGMEDDEAERRLPHQIPLKEKEGMADYVVYNNGTAEDLRKEIKTLVRTIREGWEARSTCT
jgi:dephospho-CoA kinase